MRVASALCLITDTAQAFLGQAEMPFIGCQRTARCTEFAVKQFNSFKDAEEFHEWWRGKSRGYKVGEMLSAEQAEKLAEEAWKVAQCKWETPEKVRGMDVWIVDDLTPGFLDGIMCQYRISFGDLHDLRTLAYVFHKDIAIFLAKVLNSTGGGFNIIDRYVLYRVEEERENRINP